MRAQLLRMRNVYVCPNLKRTMTAQSQTINLGRGNGKQRFQLPNTNQLSQGDELGAGKWSSECIYFLVFYSLPVRNYKAYH